MAKKPLYIQLEPGAYPKDVDWQMMSSDERGCYHSLIVFIACSDGALPNTPERLSILCNTSVAKFESFWKKYSYKFIEKNGEIQHKRITEELAKARKYIKQKSLAGKKGMQQRYNRAITPLQQSNNEAITKGREVKGSKGKVKEEEDNSIKDLIADISPTTVSAMNFTEENFTTIITEWNLISKKNPAEPHPSLQSKIVEILNDTESKVTVDLLIEAIRNLGTLKTWPHEWNLYGFMRNKNIIDYTSPRWNPDNYGFLNGDKPKRKLSEIREQG